MKRASVRKGSSPQTKRKNSSKAKSERPRLKAVPKLEENCAQCSKDLSSAPRALFVEEEVGRIFCSESCITSYFTPEIERLESEYLSKISSKDLSGSEREKLSHLRWPTLKNPDEVWREKTLSGDYRYTLISKFSPKNSKSSSKPLWCVCICLFLRGEPSFLYIAFPSVNPSLVNHFKKGERLTPAELAELKRLGKEANEQSQKEREDSELAVAEEEGVSERTTDRLASSWTQGDLLQAELKSARKKDDIPIEQFEKYLKYFEQTLEAPDEVWSTALQIGDEDENSRRSLRSRLDPAQGNSEVEVESSLNPNAVGEQKRIYHFLRAYSDQRPKLWYVIVARDTDEEEEIEILDSFPTHDESLVHRYRTGRQDVGDGSQEPQARKFLH